MSLWPQAASSKVQSVLGLPDSNSPRLLNYTQTILCAAVIGIVGGFLVTAYYYLLEGILELVWHTIPDLLTPYFPINFPDWGYVLMTTTLGGLCVGLTLRLMGLPGGVPMIVDQIHDPGLIEVRQTPAMIVASILSMGAGGSAGPEAPLVQIIGSFGSWLGQKLQLVLVSTRVLTFCGMSAALGAFFGEPLGGALFALEIPHRQSLEYYEAIVPAVLSSILSFIVFRGSTGLAIGNIYHLPEMPPMSLTNLWQGAILGVIGAGIAVVFIFLFRSVGKLTKPLEKYTISLATLGGLSIGLLAIAVPQSLFFGEREIHTIIDTGASLGAKALLIIALVKMLAICFTLNSGFRGGFICPLLYLGATFGYAIALALPQFHPTLAMVCTMAALMVAITKTPISTTVILSVLSGYAMIPVIVIASFTSFLLTTQVSLIETQRSRTLVSENLLLPNAVPLREPVEVKNT